MVPSKEEHAGKWREEVVWTYPGVHLGPHCPVSIKDEVPGIIDIIDVVP